MSQVRGRPFQPGNRSGKGRPKGSRNQTPAKVKEILDQFAEPLIKKCIARALRDDMKAMGMCLDRILAPLREPGVNLRLQATESLAQVGAVQQRIIQAVGRGEISPAEAEKIANVLESRQRTIESAQLESRIEKLEQRAADHEAKKQP